MSRILFNLGGGLSGAQCDAILAAAPAILERTGMGLNHEPTLDALKGRPGVTVSGKSIRIKAEAVQAAVSAFLLRPPRSPRPDNPPPRLLVGGEAFHIVDMDSGRVRPARSQDASDMAHLAYALGLGGVPPVAPAEGDPRVWNLMGFKLAALANPKIYNGVNTLGTPRMARAAFEISRILDRPFMISEWTTSPLVLSPDGLDQIFAFRDEDVPVGVYSMPLYGATAPLDAGSFLAQSFAELFGALFVAGILLEGRRAHLETASVDVTGFDMRLGLGAYGTPEQLLLIGAYRQCMQRLTGSAEPTHKLLTMAKLPDAQSAAERTATALWLTLAGVQTLAGGGRISMSEVYSPAQLILDLEGAAFMDRMSRGLLWKEPGVNLDLIDRVGIGGSHLDTDELLEGFRNEIWSPGLFNRESAQKWMAAPGRDMIKMALERVRACLAQPRYEVGQDKEKEVAAVFETYQKTLT